MGKEVFIIGFLVLKMYMVCLSAPPPPPESQKDFNQV